MIKSYYKIFIIIFTAVLLLSSCGTTQADNDESENISADEQTNVEPFSLDSITYGTVSDDENFIFASNPYVIDNRYLFDSYKIVINNYFFSKNDLKEFELVSIEGDNINDINFIVKFNANDSEEEEKRFDAPSGYDYYYPLRVVSDGCPFSTNLELIGKTLTVRAYTLRLNGKEYRFELDIPNIYEFADVYNLDYANPTGCVGGVPITKVGSSKKVSITVPVNVDCVINDVYFKAFVKLKDAKVYKNGRDDYLGAPEDVFPLEIHKGEGIIVEGTLVFDGENDYSKTAQIYSSVCVRFTYKNEERISAQPLWINDCSSEFDILDTIFYGGLHYEN